jgi:hypothetical protein
MASAETDRAKSGKFKSRYDRNALFPLVADVCRFVNPDEPESVSQPDFDTSRSAAGHPHAPSGRAIYGRLKRPWEEIKRIALDPARSVAHSEGAAHRVDSRKLATEEVHFALNRVARELGLRAFGFFEYARGRMTMIAADKRRHGEQGVIERLLPTAHQILHQFGSWNEALAAASLEPYTQVRGKKAISMAEAYDLLIELTGAAPKRGAFNELRSRFGISIAKTPPAATWSEAEQEIRERRAESGLETPTARRITKAEWDALEIPAELLDSLPRKRDKGYWTYERCLLALADYLDSPSAEPGLGKYQTLSAGNDDWPSSSRITQHANWTAMIAAARHLRETGEIVPFNQLATLVATP